MSDEAPHAMTAEEVRAELYTIVQGVLGLLQESQAFAFRCIRALAQVLTQRGLATEEEILTLIRECESEDMVDGAVAPEYAPLRRAQQWLDEEIKRREQGTPDAAPKALNRPARRHVIRVEEPEA